MPSVSPKQHRFMEMIAHDPEAARRVGVPQSVGQDYVAADQQKGKQKPKRRFVGKRKGAHGQESRATNV